MSMTMTEVPCDVEIRKIAGYIQQRVQYLPPKQSGQAWDLHTTAMEIFSIEPPYRFKPSETNPNSVTFTSSVSVRLPSHSGLAASTLKHARSPVQHSHIMVFEFHLFEREGERKVVSIKQPVTIASVSALVGSTLAFFPFYVNQRHSRSG